MRLAKSILSYAESLCVNPDNGQPLKFERYEYLTQPLQDLAPRLVIQKAAQVGATVMAILRALWFVDVRQAHTMYLFPTHRSAARFSKGRFSVLLEQSSYLRGLFQEVRSASHMRAGVANFYCHGARSRTELMSTPVQYLTLDERDELYLSDVTGKQPWSAADLARQRLSGQREYWELNLSTPTIPGHGIAGEFAQSDQHYFHLHCPHCGCWASPTWPDAVDSRLQSAIENHQSTIPTFRCVLCREAWSDDQRREAVRRGKWVVRNPRGTIRGYHLSQLLAPNITAERLVSHDQAAEQSISARQVFNNSMLGLPYLAEGARLDRRFIDEAMARGGYPMQHVSQGSVMGVDVGPTWLHVVIGEPVGQALRVVWAGKVHEWRELAELIQRYRVQCYVIDAMPETHNVRGLVQRFGQGYMCYYVTRSIPTTTTYDQRTTNILRVPRTESLDAMYLRWRTGNIVAPQNLPGEFIEQMQSLVRVVRIGRDGQPYAEYVEAGGPDHYAHAMNYCELALVMRGGPMRFEVIGNML